MVIGVAGTTTDVTVSIARDPALVRTVRLVAAAVARSGRPEEEFVEVVRLAVGEACALLMASDAPGDTPVTARMSADSRLRIDISCAVAPGGPVASPEATANSADLESAVLLRGLVDDFSCVQTGTDTVLSMSWPLP